MEAQEVSKVTEESIKIDHVTVAGSALAPMQRAFVDLGLKTEYGGPHSNGITHMALLGFNDGSYIELISSVEPESKPKEDVFWSQHIADDGGACAWAVQTDDIATEATRISKLGIPVDGPHEYHRQRPDGRLVEWELAFLGDKGAGAKLPFIIQDTTPRAWRVQPSASVSDGLLKGIKWIVLGVKNLQGATDLFHRVYGWSSPQHRVSSKGRLAHFPDTPIILATPDDDPDHQGLAIRLDQFDESPYAYLIATTDFEAACRRFSLEQTEEWFGHPLAWFNPTDLNGIQLGLVCEQAVKKRR